MSIIKTVIAMTAIIAIAVYFMFMLIFADNKNSKLAPPMKHRLRTKF